MFLFEENIDLVYLSNLEKDENLQEQCRSNDEYISEMVKIFLSTLLCLV